MTNKGRKITNSIVCFWFVLIYSIFVINESFAKCPVRMGTEFPPKNFLVVAHRGAASQFPENTLRAFQQALDDGANALQVDLSFTQDKQIILWHDWNPNDSIALIRQEGRESVVKFKPFAPPKNSQWRKKTSNLPLNEFRKRYGYVEKESNFKSKISIPVFKEFIEWAKRQGKLKFVFFKLKIPEDESRLVPFMFDAIKKILSKTHPKPQFQIVFSISSKKNLYLAKKQFNEFDFSYDREIPPIGVVNYDQFTTIPTAMDLDNKFSGIGLPIYRQSSKPFKPDPWIVYRFILTRDFKLRDNFRKSGSQNIKIFSWNFNDENKMTCLIRLGVDGIVTDKPKLLRSIALKLGKNLDLK